MPPEKKKINQIDPIKLATFLKKMEKSLEEKYSKYDKREQQILKDFYDGKYAILDEIIDMLKEADIGGRFN